MRFQVEGWAAEWAKLIVACLLAAAPVIIAQVPSTAPNVYRQRAVSREGTLSPGGAPVHILREINDRHSGIRWFIFRNPQNPAGPALIASENENPPTDTESVTRDMAPSSVIRAGDHVVLEEHTTAAESYLDAIALGSAAVGVTLDVRLKIGGKVMRAVAIAPGRALLAPLREERP